MPSGLKILLVLLAFAFPAIAGEWPGVPYSEIRAYAWPIDQNEDEVVLPGIKLHPGAVKNSGAVLSANQTARLLAAQKRRSSPRPQAGCYVPHNAFVFYDAKNKPVAYMELCFDCLGSHLLPADADCDPDFVALAKIFSELKLPFGRFKSFAAFRENTQPILHQ